MALWLLALPGLAQETAEREAAGTFAGETSVTLVEVPVQVLDDGDPVRGLGRESFRVMDGDEERPILSFEVVETVATAADDAAGPAPAGTAAVPAAGRRSFLLFFDLSFTDQAALARAQRAAKRLVAEQLAPSDLVGLAFYSDRKGISMPLAFTSDRRAVGRVLDAFGVLLGEDAPEEARETAAALGMADDEANDEADDDSRREQRRRDPLGLSTEGDWRVLSTEISGANDTDTDVLIENFRMGLGTPITAALYGELRDGERVRTRAEARAMVESLGLFARRLAGVGGAKHLVMFSNGFPSWVYGAGRVRVGLGVSESLAAMERAVEELRRSGWVLHTIELSRSGGMLAGESLGGGSLFFLAEETGGTFERRNDPAESLGAVLERTSVTYVLTFQSPEIPADGSFRPLEVELVDAPRGVDVVHKEGYWAPRPLDESRGLERRVEAARLLVAGGERDDLGARVLVAPQPGVASAAGSDDGGVPVAVVVAVDGAGLVPPPGRERERSGLEVYTYALDADGAVVDFTSRILELDLARVGDSLARGGVKLYGDLFLPPGRYEVRTLARSLDTGALTLRSVPLTVEPIRAGTPSLAPAVFLPDGSTPWLLVRDDSRAGEAPPFPFVMEGQEFLPEVEPVLAPGQVGRLVTRGRDLPRESFRLEVVVEGADGAAIEEGWAAQLLGRVAFAGTSGASGGEAAGDDQLHLAFSPLDLAPGRYRLGLVVVDEDGVRRPAGGWTGFRVAPDGTATAGAVEASVSAADPTG